MHIGNALVLPSRAAWVICLSAALAAGAARAAEYRATTIVSNSGSFIADNGLVAVTHSSAGAIAWSSSGAAPPISSFTPTGISADGAIVFGYGPYAGNSAGYRIKDGVATLLDPDQDEFDTKPTGASSDGKVIVGTRFWFTGIDYQTDAYRWSEMGGFEILPSFSGLGIANAVSADGTIVVGGGLASADSYETAVRWVVDSNGHVTGDMLDPGTNSEAVGISADGSTIIGTVGDPQKHAFRWTESGGTLDDITPSVTAGYDAIPNGVSDDGMVVIGNFVEQNNGTGSTAFRWSGNQLLTFDTLTDDPGTDTHASAMSSDGSVVVGTLSNGNDQTSQAFRWTEAKGMVSLDDLLAGAGVDLGGDTLATADDVSANGKIVVGKAKGAAHTAGAVFYIADLDGVDDPGAGSTSGVITTDVIDASFASLGAPPAGNNTHLGSIFDEFGQFGPPRSDGPSAFGYGGADTDPAKSGGFGVVAPLGASFLVGVIVDASTLTEDLAYGGSSDFTAGLAVAFLARNSRDGLQLLLGAGGDVFGGSISRGYLDGATPVTSTGRTGGYGYAAEGQLGWRFGDGSDGVSLMPFVSGMVASTRVNGYTETDGPFPATLGSLSSTTTQVRAGLEARIANANGFAVSARVAGVHSAGGTGPISGKVVGLLALSGSPTTSVTDWLETGAGLDVPFGPSTDASLGLVARFPIHGTRSFAGQAGVRVSF